MADGNNQILVGELRLDLGTLQTQVQAANSLLNSIGENAAQNLRGINDAYRQMIEGIGNASRQAQQAASAARDGGNDEDERNYVRDLTGL